MIPAVKPFLLRLFRRTPRISFYEYLDLLARRTFHIYTHFEMFWYLDVMAKHIQEVVEGKYRHVLFLLPPSHGKTSLCSSVLPSYLFYYHMYNPIDIGMLHHQASLAKHLTRETIKSIEGNTFGEIAEKARWIGKNPLTLDSKKKGRFEMSNSSRLYTVYPDKSFTGLGFDYLISDELNMLSRKDFCRDGWGFYELAATCRMKSSESKSIHATSRFKEDDIAGRMMKRGISRGKVIILRAIAEEDEVWEGASGRVYTRKRGEVLCPVIADHKKLAKIQVNIGDDAFQALYQQNPVN